MTDDLRRFFVPAGSVRARNVTMGPEMAHRLGRVLRFKRGDRVVLSEGGRDFEVEITGISGNALTAVVVSEREAPAEPAIRLTLYQSLIRQNRFDLVLEKGAEIGVARFVPVIAARTQTHGNGEPSSAKAERWTRIVVEAAEQCGRGRPPEVAAPVVFEEAVRTATGLKLMPYEGERSLGLTRYLADVLPRPREVALFIGPEGGFEQAEVDAAAAAGAVFVTLGHRLLRSETAGIVASAFVLDTLGEMGS
jgi:16S rRNA (uracil1498-N3)-methyltransferase